MNANETSECRCHTIDSTYSRYRPEFTCCRHCVDRLKDEVETLQVTLHNVVREAQVLRRRLAAYEEVGCLPRLEAEVERLRKGAEMDRAAKAAQETSDG